MNETKKDIIKWTFDLDNCAIKNGDIHHFPIPNYQFLFNPEGEPFIVVKDQVVHNQINIIYDHDKFYPFFGHITNKIVVYIISHFMPNKTFYPPYPRFIYLLENDKKAVFEHFNKKDQ